MREFKFYYILKLQIILYFFNIKELPARKEDLLKKAGELATHFPNGPVFKYKAPTAGIVQGYLKRNPDLQCRKTLATTPDRAKVTKLELMFWHGEVGSRMTPEGRIKQFHKPENIFNMDEIGFTTNAKNVTAIFKRGAKRNHTIAFGHLTSWTFNHNL